MSNDQQVIDASTPVTTRSREDIELLKKAWLKDPCWDIENTEGYEAHRNELAEFHKKTIDESEEKQKLIEEKKRTAWHTLKINEQFRLDNYTTIRRVPGGWIYTETMCSKEPSSRDHDDAQFVMCQTFIPSDKNIEGIPNEH